jgi:GNAT superfamily N-acetyltransferase
MSDVLIEELVIPPTLDGPAGDDLRAACLVSTVVRSEIVGPADGTVVAEDELPRFLDQTYDRVRVFVARADNTIVGNAYLEWSTDQDTRVSWLDLEVLPAYRNRGIGTALFDRIEGEAIASGRPIAQGGALHEPLTDDERLPSATGYGSIALADPSLRFLRKRGYTLEQIHRRSILYLPVPTDRLETLPSAPADMPASYRLHTWQGPVPERWRDGVAHLLGRLRVDAPYGNLDMGDAVWDAQRVVSEDGQRMATGQTPLVAVVEHEPTGDLVAYSSLTLQQDRTRPAIQGTTLVLREHRGHRFGLLTKATTLRQVMTSSPETPSIVTNNAEDNQPMLRVNDLLGFEPLAYIGAWKKTFEQDSG